MNTLFIQFYSIDQTGPKFLWSSKNNTHEHTTHKSMLLGNGLSHVLNVCKDMGDVVWIRYDLEGTLDEIIEKNKPDIDLPFTRGTVYVSAMFVSHMFYVYRLAKGYPDVRFIVGGSAVGFILIEEHNKLLPNLHFTREHCWEVIKSNVEPKWGIDFPITDEKIKGIALGYPTDSSYYWNKCIFCGYKPSIKTDKDYWQTDFLDNIPSSNCPYIIVHYNCPSTHVEFFDCFPEMCNREDNLYYSIFIRADKNVIEKLKNVLPKCKYKNKLLIFIGLEFPSNRMLNFFNKGVTLENYLELHKLLASYDIFTSSTVLMGWDNLIENDIEEAEQFISQLDFKFNLSIRPITALASSQLHNGNYFNNSKHKKIYNGPFYIGFAPVLNKEQFKLNKQIVDLFFNQPIYRIADTYSGGSLGKLSPYWNNQGV